MESFVQATSVCMDGVGVLIMGKSGSGKSMMALALIEQGACLIADDVTYIKEENGVLYAYPDEKMKGCIEARGIGILTGLKSCDQKVKIAYGIELVDGDIERLPQEQTFGEYLGCRIPVFKMNTNEKYLPTLVKIAGKIVLKRISLLSVD